jgi:spore germination cell wall hydrolase CwlJ-like protein
LAVTKWRHPPPPLGSAASAPAPALSLEALVDARSGLEAVDADRECVATAVYFEARGEPIEGQLAVAQVVLNRAASGKYPSSVCAVVKQRSQFSFIRRGKIPPIAKATEAWRKAVAIARIAWERLANQIGGDVLWYHAIYVSPGWGRRLTRVAQIGTHIFYN